MTSEHQLQYLNAMGITTWVRREVESLADEPEPVADFAPPENAQAIPNEVPSERPQTATADGTQEQWKSLAAMVTHCTLCELHRERTQTVFGVGNQSAQVMVIGEAPGYHEDQQGEPFVGRAGSLLNRMLQAIGFSREQVYIANVLKCRPPNNRDPRAEESQSCHRYLEQQIDLVDPQVILAVGRISAQHLLDSDSPIGRLRGQVHQFPGRDLPIVVTYHPAYLLRSPEQKAKAFADLLMLKKQLAMRIAES